MKALEHDKKKQTTPPDALYELPPIDEKINDALAALDQVGARGDIETMTGVSHLVAVVAGVKPATMMGREEFEDLCDIDEMIDRLGLVLEDFAGPRKQELIAVSKDPELAHRLAEVFAAKWANRDDNGRADREIGKLLGYPETATDYFLARQTPDGYLPTVDSYDKGELRHFTQFILSHDNHEDEVDAYSKPLAEATRLLAPETYACMTRQRQQGKLSRLVAKLFGKSKG